MSSAVQHKKGDSTSGDNSAVDVAKTAEAPRSLRGMGLSDQSDALRPSDPVQMKEDSTTTGNDNQNDDETTFIPIPVDKQNTAPADDETTFIPIPIDKQQSRSTAPQQNTSSAQTADKPMTAQEYLKAKGSRFEQCYKTMLRYASAANVLPSSGGKGQIKLEHIDMIERDMVYAVTPDAPAEIQHALQTQWPLLVNYRQQWTAAIQQSIQAYMTLASNIAADPDLGWPDGYTYPELPGDAFFHANGAVPQSALYKQWEQAQLSATVQVNKAEYTALRHGMVLKNDLMAGAQLDPNRFLTLRSRLYRFEQRKGPHAVEIGTMIASLNSLEAVRSDARIEPHSTSAGTLKPEGELHLFTAPGGDAASFSQTGGKAAPTEAELAKYISARDVLQGGLADCFLMASMAAVANTKPSLIANSITETSPGVYQVRLYEPTHAWGPPPQGQMREISVSVNHQLVTKINNRGEVVSGTATLNQEWVERGVWSFIRNLGQKTLVTELWAVIMEKAVAKAQPHGYESIANGGNTALAFQMLTGAPAETEKLPYPAQADVEKTKMWNDLHSHLAANLPAAAGSDVNRIVYAASPQSVYQGLLAGQQSGGAQFTHGDPHASQVAAMAQSNNVNAMRQLVLRLYHACNGADFVNDMMFPISADAKVFPWHAYTVLSAREVHQADGTSQRIVRLRNPWGCVVQGGDGTFGEFELTFDQFLGRFGEVYLGNFNPPTS